MPLILAREAMRTRFELVLDGASEPVLRRIGEAALDEVLAAEAEWSRFRRDSVLSWIHREAGRGPVRLRADHFALLDLCVRVHRDSEGAFDPTVAALLDRDESLGGRAADRAALDAPRGLRHLHLDPAARTVHLEHPGLRLDLGGVAKGWAIDRAVEVLRDEGVERALLHGGTSTVAALGHPPDAEAWWVGVRDPRPDPAAAEILVRIPLRDAALSVSGAHGREVSGGAHVLDPRTGAPTSRALAVVVSEEATSADAWSTALLAGSESSDGAWCRWARDDPGAALASDGDDVALAPLRREEGGRPRHGWEWADGREPPLG